ncbi:flippase [Patescibacteria group bacterium]|nr:flippase [Patescibacteria group bacterium]
MNLKTLFLQNINTKQIVFKNTSWLMLAEIVSKTPTFFLNVLIARYLGAENYGQFTFAFAFGSLFIFFTDLGLSTLIIREVAKNENSARKYIDNLLMIKLILSFIVFVLIFSLIQILNKPSETKDLIFLVGIFIIISSFITFFQSIIQAFEKMEYLAISKIIYSTSLVPIILLIVWQGLGVKTLTRGYLYSALITLIITAFLVRKKFSKFWLERDTDFWKKALSNAWPFGLIGLLGTVYLSMRTVQINLISGNIEAGWYNAAYQFIFVLMTLVGIFYTALFPALSKEYAKSKINFYRIIDFVAKKVILLSFFACLSLFLASQKTILLLYGPSYIKSANMLRFLSISIFISFISITYSEGLRIMNLQKEYLKTLFWGVLLNFLLNFPLIFLWGGLGASLAAIFSSLLITVLIIIKFRKFKKEDLCKI